MHLASGQARSGDRATSETLTARQQAEQTRPRWTVRAPLRLRLDIELVLLLLFSAFAIGPLLSPGYFFDAHDADHSVFFLVQFDAAIRDGVLWPRWGPDHALGFGYPLWLVYAPLAYFLAEGFHLLGLGFTAAVKATWIIAFVAGGWGMMALLRHWFGRGPVGRAAALVAGLVYVYAPYHLLNVYVRAALAEFCALAWFPWVLLAFDRVVQRASWSRVAVAALALAGLLLTHTGSILIFTPLLLAYLAYALLRRGYRAARRPLDRVVQDAGAQSSRDAEETLATLGLSSPVRIGWRAFWQAAVRVLAAGLLAVGLAAIFLLPLVLEQGYIVQSQWVQGTYGYRLHFVHASQFLDPFWGFGYSDDPVGVGDGMSFQLGIIAVGLALAALVISLRRGAHRRGTTAFFLLSTLVCLLLMLPLAQPLWDAFGPAALIQFPWRLLGVTAFTLAILAGSAVASLLTLRRQVQAPAPLAAASQPGGVSEPAGAGEAVAEEGAVRAQKTAHHGATSPAAYVLALIVVLASFPYLVPQYTNIEPIDESPQSIIRFETAHPDMIGITAYSQEAPVDSPLVSQYQSGQPLRKAALANGSGQVETLRVGGASVEARVNLEEPGTVLFHTYDFPGWRATLDGETVPHRPQPPYGLIAVDVPAGEHLVTIRHGTTTARTIGALISAASLLLVGWLFWQDRRSRAPSGGA